jgi:hypothetical protein
VAILAPIEFMSLQMVAALDLCLTGPTALRRVPNSSWYSTVGGMDGLEVAVGVGGADVAGRDVSGASRDLADA